MFKLLVLPAVLTAMALALSGCADDGAEPPSRSASARPVVVEVVPEPVDAHMAGRVPNAATLTRHGYDPQSISSLALALRAERIDVQLAACTVASKIGATELLPHLHALLREQKLHHSYELLVRYEAVSALAELSPSTDVRWQDIAIDLLACSDLDIAFWSARLLAEHGRVDGYFLVVEYLEEDATTGWNLDAATSVLVAHAGVAGIETAPGGGELPTVQALLNRTFARSTEAQQDLALAAIRHQDAGKHLDLEALLPLCKSARIRTQLETIITPPSKGPTVHQYRLDIPREEGR